MSDTRHDWREALAATPDCLDLSRLGEELDAEAGAHVESCARCQSELALFDAITNEKTSAEEEEAARWIVERANVVQPFTPRSGGLKKARRTFVYAAAAAMLVVIGAGWFLELREPEVDLTAIPTLYRGARLDAIAPIGEIPQAPNELRWTAVPEASRYHVTIFEVDAMPVWSSSTTQSRAALPADVAAQFAPGKTLLWKVDAYRANDLLTSSETQNVRVSVSIRKTP